MAAPVRRSSPDGACWLAALASSAREIASRGLHRPFLMRASAEGEPVSGISPINPDLTLALGIWE